MSYWKSVIPQHFWLEVRTKITTDITLASYVSVQSILMAIKMVKEIIMSPQECRSCFKHFHQVGTENCYSFLIIKAYNVC